MIPYEFVPMDRSFFKFLYNGNFSKNEILVLIAIAEDVFSWPEKRATGETCISVSYISKRINIDKGNATKAINNLIKKGILLEIEPSTFKQPRKIAFADWRKERC